MARARQDAIVHLSVGELNLTDTNHKPMRLMTRSRRDCVESQSYRFFYLVGEYTDHADGKALLYQAKRDWPGYMVERVTRRTLQHLEAIG